MIWSMYKDNNNNLLFLEWRKVEFIILTENLLLLILNNEHAIWISKITNFVINWQLRFAINSILRENNRLRNPKSKPLNLK
jgi:riboflavin transporter FmnP